MRRQKPSPGKTLSTKVACAPSKSEPGSSTRAVSPSLSTIRIGAITSSRPKICRGPLYPYHIGEQNYEYERWHRWHRKDGPARCPQPAGTWLCRLWVSSSHDRRFHYHGGYSRLIEQRSRATLRYRPDVSSY